MRYFVPTFRLLLIVSLCIGIVLAAGCARQPVAPKSEPVAQVLNKGITEKKPAKHIATDPDVKQPTAPRLEVNQGGVTISWSDKSGRTMKAVAKSDSYNLRTQVGSLLDFSAKLYENGALLATMSAPHAYIDTDKRVVVATGGVDLQFTKPPTHVKSSWIKWTPDSHKIVGNGGVTMKYPSGTANAAAFVGDTAKQTLELRDSGKGLE